MIFTSITFLVFYAILILLLLLFKGNIARQSILLFASYFFYAWWNPTFIILIFLSSLWAWYLGLLIDRTNCEKRKSLYLAISLFLSLGMLAYYKYAQFLVENISTLLGYEWNNQLDILLPVGISFFTFQTMSYGIDLKRGKIPVCKSLPQFMLFVAFFPQLVAGPIVRASEFLPQLTKKIRITKQNFIIGFQLFLGGAIQKVLFADNLSIFVDPVFENPLFYSSDTLWLALFAYSLQIFCDFSGYSLMAIGVARTLGFQLPKNFDMPYISRSITEFWRRWHMTLSFWLRDYLYISLGGNRKGEIRTYLHLLITMLLGGLWHGASWNFILWGGLHGIALALHKVWLNQTASLAQFKERVLYKSFAWGITILFVVLAWIPFRCADFETSYIYFTHLFGNDNASAQWTNPHVLLLILIAAIWHIMYLVKSSLLMRFPQENIFSLYPYLVISLSILFIIMFAPLETSPFIYFQF